MKYINIILSTIFLLAGMTANAQMPGGMHNNMQQDSSRINNYRGNMQSGHMMGQGMMPFMMDGHMNTMHGMSGNDMMNRQGSGMMHSGMLNHLPMLDEELDLSSDQVNRLNNMKESFMEESEKLINKVNSDRKRLVELVSNDVSTEQYRKQLVNYYQSLAELQGAAYETSNEMKDVLTEEQMQKLENQVAGLRHHHNGDVQDDHYMDQNHREGMHHNW